MDDLDDSRWGRALVADTSCCCLSNVSFCSPELARRRLGTTGALSTPQQPDNGGGCSLDDETASSASRPTFLVPVDAHPVMTVAPAAAAAVDGSRDASPLVSIVSSVDLGEIRHVTSEHTLSPVAATSMSSLSMRFTSGLATPMESSTPRYQPLRRFPYSFELSQRNVLESRAQSTTPHYYGGGGGEGSSACTSPRFHQSGLLFETDPAAIVRRAQENLRKLRQQRYASEHQQPLQPLPTTSQQKPHQQEEVVPSSSSCGEHDHSVVVESHLLSAHQCAVLSIPPPIPTVLFLPTKKISSCSCGSGGTGIVVALSQQDSSCGRDSDHDEKRAADKGILLPLLDEARTKHTSHNNKNIPLSENCDDPPSSLLSHRCTAVTSCPTDVTTSTQSLSTSGLKEELVQRHPRHPHPPTADEKWRPSSRSSSFSVVPFSRPRSSFASDVEFVEHALRAFCVDDRVDVNWETRTWSYKKNTPVPLAKQCL